MPSPLGAVSHISDGAHASPNNKPGNFGNTTNRQCQACSTKCKTCVDNADKCTSCPSGASLYNDLCLSVCPVYTYSDPSGYCLPCGTDCETCTSNTQCTLCKASSGKYLYGGACVSACPTEHYYPDPATKTCESCPQQCLQCSSADVCTQCDTSRFTLAGGKCLCSQAGYIYDPAQDACVSGCPSHYFVNAQSVCQACSADCLDCSQEPNFCTSCYATHYFYQAAKFCYTVCPQSSFPVLSPSKICVACPTYCKACTNSTYCSSCIDTAYFYQSFCYAQHSCPTGLYSDDITKSCVTCPFPCTVCSTHNSCSQCRTPTFRLEGDQCKCVGDYVYYPGTQQCITNCPLGFYNASGVCQPCQDPCKTCAQTATTCKSCLYGKFLENGLCVSQCGSANYVDPTGILCLPCDSLKCLTCFGAASNCTACDANEYLLNNFCHTSCPDKVIAPQTSRCPRAPLRAQARFVTRAPLIVHILLVTRSRAPRLLLALTLTSRTGPGLTAQYYPSTGVCLACVPGCMLCNGPLITDCTACNNDCQASNGQCICRESTFMLGNTCVAQCLYDQYPDAMTKSCKKCTGECLTCLTSSYCLSCTQSIFIPNSQGVCVCRDGKLFDGTGCIGITSSCTQGYYKRDSYTCVKCMAFCRQCDSATFCISCQPSFDYSASTKSCECLSGTFLATDNTCKPLNQCSSSQYTDLAGNCVSSCGTGTYNYLAGHQCLPCVKNCINCVGGSSCSQCQPNMIFDAALNACICDQANGYFIEDGKCTKICLGKPPLRTCPSSLEFTHIRNATPTLPCLHYPPGFAGGAGARSAVTKGTRPLQSAIICNHTSLWRGSRHTLANCPQDSRETN